LTDADAERIETQHWLDTTIACGYIPKDEKDVLEMQLEEIGRMLNAMMSKSHLFCKQEFLIIKEEQSEFLINDTII